MAHMFAERARGIWLAYLKLRRGPSGAAAEGMVRVLVEAWIVFRWVQLRPEVHAALWWADGDRHDLEILLEAPAKVHPNLAERLRKSATPALVRRKQELVAEARRDGLAAGVRGVSRNADKPLLPSVALMVDVLDVPEIREVYALAYSTLSGWTHTASTSMRSGGPEEERPSEGTNVLAAVVFAAILGDTSASAGFGIQADAWSLRRALTAITP